MFDLHSLASRTHLLARVGSSVALVSLVALVAAVGCGAPEEDDGDPGDVDEAESELSVETSFQNGVSPSSSYTGTADATLQQHVSATNAGADPIVRMDTDYPNESGSVANAVLRFDVRAIPAGSAVKSVKLTVNVTNRTSGQGFTLYALKRAWTEGQTTWARASSGAAWSSGGARGASDRDSAPLGTLLPTATGKYTLALNAAGVAVVQRWVNDPATNFGFVLDAAKNPDGLEFDSSEASTAANRPRLSVGYDTPFAGGTGLRGQYFTGRSFERLAATRTDATVNFSWGAGALAPGLPVDDVSVRWSGKVVPLHSQTYSFYTTSDDGVRLWVDGKLLVDNWTNHAATENVGTIALTAGRSYDIRMDYYEAGGNAVAQLAWSSASQAKQVVPASQLFPATGEAVPAPSSNACEAQKQARRALVPGSYKPSASTTGPVPCVSLTRHNGTYTVNEPGTVVEGLDIYGNIVLGPNARNVVVRNTVVRGDAYASGKTSVITGGGGANDRLGLVVEDSILDLTGRENWFVNGLEGANLTVRRTEIKRSTDGIGLVSERGNVLVEGCWIHDGAHFTWTDDTPQPKPGHKDNQTHNDGVQFHRGKNLVLRGNFIGGDRAAGDDYRNAGVMISQAVNADPANRLDDVLIEKNWFQGGAATINMAYSNGNDLRTVTIRDNRFLRGPGYYILKNGAIQPSLSNNVFDDTNQPVPVVQK